MRSPEPQDAAAERILEELARQPEPEYDAIGRRRDDAPARRRALAGHVMVLDEELELSLPIDWDADPHGNRSWRYRLHTLEFLDVLCRTYGDEDNETALRLACEVALDWVRHNRRGEPGVSEFAWYDMAAGIRAPYLGYLLRAGVGRSVLSRPEATDLLESAVDHGRFLADDANYAQGHNHGLFQDEGLLMLAHHLEVVPESRDWLRKARSRFSSTVALTVDAQDGVHLEHSPAYHCAVANMLGRLSARDPELGDRLAELRERMVSNAGWMVTPSCVLCPVGDTDPIPAPRWLRRQGEKASGLRGFAGAGYAVVKVGTGFLFVCAGYHSHAHKHGDELSFVLEEGGVGVITDPGRFAYEEQDPRRRFARSALAHNGLIVDGEGFSWEQRTPYGSGIEAFGSGAGWFAVETVNPLLREVGVEHRRLFLYRPGLALIIVDELESGAEHTYSRLLHFDPGLSCAAQGDGAVWEGEGAGGSVRDRSETAVNSNLVRGQREPHLQGWCFPGERQEREAFALEMEVVASSVRLCTVLSLGEEEPGAVEVSGDDQRLLRATLGGDELEMAIARVGGRLRLVQPGEAGGGSDC